MMNYFFYREIHSNNFAKMTNLYYRCTQEKIKYFLAPFFKISSFRPRNTINQRLPSNSIIEKME